MAVAAGGILTAAAFGAFARIYRFVPVSAISVLVAFAVIFSALLYRSVRTDASFADAASLVPAVLTGFGIGLYAMGALEFGSLGPVLFTVACLMSYYGVAVTARARARAFRLRATTCAGSVLLLEFVPSLLLVMNLSKTTLYLPELLRESVLASFLALLGSATVVGLAVAAWHGHATPARR